ncbi:MAG: diguanylate cyclase domain-containing protein, partial [Nitrospiria bacterium]
MALLYYMEARSVRFTFETDESRYVARQKELIGNELKSIVSDLMVFAADNRAQQALERDDTGDWKTVAEEFISLLRSRDRYDQIRLINKAGLEVVRVAVRDGEPNIISEDLLQSISEGDDLNEVLKLERDEIYLSSFDLHIKMGAERQTSGIVIRVGMPFFDNGGRYLGAIIFDYPGAHLASLMEKIRSHDLVADLLLTGDGSDLGRTIKGESGDWNPAVPFQEAWQGISEADSGQFYTGDGLFTFATLYPFSEVQGSIREFGKTPRFGTNQKNQNPEGWKVVSFVPKGVLNAPSGKFLRKSFIFYILFSGLLAVGSLVLARIAVNRKVAETALRESDIQIRNIVNTTLDGIVITNDKGVVALFNPAAEQIFGYKSSEVIGESVNRLIPGPYRKEQNNYPSHYLDNDGRRNAGARREVIGQRKDGTRFPIELAVSEVRLKDRRLFTGIVRDITSRREMEEQLRHKAYHDTLTSLPNRSLMVSRLKRSIKLAKTRKDYLFAVLFLDLDRFKVINDSLGHAIGDQLLIAISRRLEKCLRPGDTVARIGGDELAILLEDVGEVGFVKRVSDRIHKEVALPFNINGHEIFNTVSIGIALSSTGYEKPEDILRDADIAMYRAKILGKSRHEIFDKVMHN